MHIASSARATRDRVLFINVRRPDSDVHDNDNSIGAHAVKCIKFLNPLVAVYVLQEKETKKNISIVTGDIYLTSLRLDKTIHCIYCRKLNRIIKIVNSRTIETMILVDSI